MICSFSGIAEASKSEGTLLSVVAGKDVHEKFAAQQEKTFKSFEKVAMTLPPFLPLIFPTRTDESLA